MPHRAVVCLVASLFALAVHAEDWPSFRGANAAGISAEPLPTEWNGETDQNILWRTAIPGLGHSGSVLWGDHLYVTTAVAEAEGTELKVGLYGDIASADDNGTQSWRLYCLDKNTGEVLWHRVAYEGVPKTKRHTKSSHANPTPAADGERVLAFFGSEGLYAYSHDGKLLWSKDLGLLRSSFFMLPAAEWGFASSPLLHDGKVIIQADVIGKSFLVVLDAADGREIWRTDRTEFPTWSTPTIYRGADGREQIVVNGFKHMGGYDLATGEPIWHLTGGGDIPVPTPVVHGDLVYLTNAHGARSPVYAINASTAKGDISLEGDATSNGQIAWSVPRGGSYMQTPLVYDGEIYVCQDSGILMVFDAVEGTERYKERLAVGKGFTASAIAGGGHVYFTSEEGVTHVIKAGATFEKVAENPLGEIVMATPAASDGVIYFRARGHVVAVGERVPETE